MIKLFKKKRPNTAIHPTYKKLVEEVAEINGRKIYQFKNLADMPINRHNKCDRFSSEFHMRLDSQILLEALDNIEEQINKGNITKVAGIIAILKEHTKMLISMDASYRLASCVYFWEDEDLTDYDFEIGDEKIELFKKEKFDDFFFTERTSKFLPQIDLSNHDLVTFLRYEKQLKDLLYSTLNSQKSKEKQTT